MNKKGQMDMPMPGQLSKNGPHPVLIFGIILFIVPFFSIYVTIPFPTFFKGLGLVFILLGAVLSMFRNA